MLGAAVTESLSVTSPNNPAVASVEEAMKKCAGPLKLQKRNGENYVESIVFTGWLGSTRSRYYDGVLEFYEGDYLDTSLLAEGKYEVNDVELPKGTVRGVRNIPAVEWGLERTAESLERKALAVRTAAQNV